MWWELFLLNSNAFSVNLQPAAWPARPLTTCPAASHTHLLLARCQLPWLSCWDFFFFVRDLADNVPTLLEWSQYKTRWSVRFLPRLHFSYHPLHLGLPGPFFYLISHPHQPLSGKISLCYTNQSLQWYIPGGSFFCRSHVCLSCLLFTVGIQ